MRIKIIAGKKVATAVLADNVVGRDFAKLLPLSLKLKDFNGTEKITDLGRKLDIKGEPPGIKPSKGDLTYYAPWGNLAIFYKDFRYSPGLISLGKITGGMELFSFEETVDVKIESEN